MPTVVRIRCLRVDDPGVLHRFHNFGEDVYRLLSDACEIDVDEVDGASGEFSLRAIKTRKASRVTSVVRNLVGQHMLDSEVELSTS